MASTSVNTLFGDDVRIGIPIFVGARDTVDYEEITPSEKRVVERVFRTGLNQIRKVSPKIAADLEPQLGVAIKFAGIFKRMIPQSKSITFPSEAGTIGVNWLFPQAIKYTATPSSAEPAYTSYENNSWNLSLVAGTPAYLFGSATNMYKSCPVWNKNSAILVFNNGLIEIGSTPVIQQFRISAEGFDKLGPYTVAPVTEVSIEEDKNIYQYPTPLGATLIFPDRGIRWSILPEKGTSSSPVTATIKLLGLVFYEHEFAADLKWI